MKPSGDLFLSVLDLNLRGHVRHPRLLRIWNSLGIELVK